MQVQTPRFGALQIPDEVVLFFPWGIYGFPGLRECCLLPCQGAPTVRWLQCLNDPCIAFLTAEPHALFPDYEFDLPEAEAAELDLERAEQAAVITVLTISRETRALTASLAAPIIINIRTRRARQVILDDPRYTTRHLVAEKWGAGDAGSDTQDW